MGGGEGHKSKTKGLKDFGGKGPGQMPLNFNQHTERTGNSKSFNAEDAEGVVAAFAFFLYVKALGCPPRIFREIRCLCSG